MASTRLSGRRTVAAAAAYSGGFIVQKAIGMILLPFYTRAISPAQYGLLGVLMSLSMAANVIFSVGMDTAVTRNYFQMARDPAARQSYIDSVWRALVVFPLALAVVLSLVVWPFVTNLGSVSESEVALMLASSALNVAATTLPFAVLRARQDLRAYLILTAVLALLTPALTWVFVIVVHDGVEGWFLAAAIANAATLMTAFVIVPWHRRGKYEWRYVQMSVIFSLPLMPHFLSHWALQVADRLVISSMVTASSLGVYTLAANLAAPQFALLQALNSAFLPSYGRAGADPQHEEELTRVVVLQIASVVAVTLAAALIGPSAVTILAPRGYHYAASLIPWLALGNGFVGLYFVPMNGATVGAGRRKFAFIATMTSALTNIALLYIFVPSGGIYAAAVADAAAFLVLLVLMSGWARLRPTPVHYRWNPIFGAVAIASAAYVGCLLTTPDGKWPGLLCRCAWTLLGTLGVGFPYLRRRAATLSLKRRRFA